MKLLKLLFILAIFSQTMFPASFGFHTFHTSLTRMDFNEKDKIIEVSIQVFTHDIISVLEKISKKKIDLEETPDVDTVIQKYLSTNFILKNKKSEEMKFRWVGKEVRAETTYLYFEIPSEEGFENYLLYNTLFFESFPEQTNIIIGKITNKKADLYFKVGDKPKELVFKTN